MPVPAPAPPPFPPFPSRTLDNGLDKATVVARMMDEQHPRPYVPMSTEESP